MNRNLIQDDNNIWSGDFLRENPSYAFNAFRPQRGTNFGGASRSFFDFYKNRQPQLEREFVGQQGRLAASGRPPTGEFSDFIQQYPWLQRYLELPPSQRGVKFSTPARWIIPR